MNHSIEFIKDQLNGLDIDDLNDLKIAIDELIEQLNNEVGV